VLGSGGGGSGGGVFGLPGGLIDKAILGALALTAVGLMISMVRKSGKTPDLPTAEELVGLPPALDAKSDLIGEADETDTPMAGIEVGEEEVHSQKVLEQVQELVEKTPDSAAKMLNRWITVEP
jgi:flagellar biosynthesis/type III secretory pathway M-ring protein FliF/YscJ